MKNYFIALLRIAVPLGIFVWLILQAQNKDPGTFQKFVARPKDEARLALALAACFVGVSLSFVRWYVLVRALHIPFRLLDAFRLGYIGYLLNFVSLGAVGGDLFKAFFIAREQPNRRPEAIATIVVDRAMGLFTLLLLASAAFFVLTRYRSTPAIRIMAVTCWLLAGSSAAAMLAFLSRRISVRRLAYFAQHIRWLRNTVLRLDDALRLYQQHWRSLALAVMIGLLTHTLLACCIYLAASAVFSPTPPLGEHLVMWPIAGAVSALPIAPAGLGTFEAVLSYLYAEVATCPFDLGSGLVVALMYRTMTIIVAGIGMGFYWFGRGGVSQAIHEAEEYAS